MPAIITINVKSNGQIETNAIGEIQNREEAVSMASGMYLFLLDQVPNKKEYLTVVKTIYSIAMGNAMQKYPDIDDNDDRETSEEALKFAQWINENCSTSGPIRP